MVTLKQLREVAGLSQIEVSYKANISSSRLSLFENGLGQLTAEEQGNVRKGIVAMAKDRAKWTTERAKRTVTEAAPSTRNVVLRDSNSRPSGFKPNGRRPASLQIPM